MDLEERAAKAAEGFPGRLQVLVNEMGGVATLASSMGVATAKVYAWLNGATPNTDSLIELAVATGADLDWLLLGRKRTS